MNLKEIFMETQLLGNLIYGIKDADERLVGTTIKQLLEEGHQRKIGNVLEDSFKQGLITESMQRTIARTLSEGSDQFLRAFGNFLLEAKTADPFGEFAKQTELDLDTPPYKVLPNNYDREGIEIFWKSMSLSQKVAAKFDIAIKTGRT